jgi:hypothetical protein
MSLTYDRHEIGIRTGTAFLVSGLGALTGSPIGGALVGQMHGDYLGLQAFCGTTMLVATAFYVASRFAQAGFTSAKV